MNPRALLDRYLAPGDFEPGVGRILLGLWAAWFHWIEVLPRMERYGSRAPELFQPPVWALFFRHEHVELGGEHVGGLAGLSVVLVLATVLGVVSRVSTGCLFLLTVYLGLCANSWGYTVHSSGLPTLALGILVFAPGLARHSLMARWRRQEVPVQSAWPKRLIIALIAITYFATGLSKLRHGGPEWLDGKTLAFYAGGGSPRPPLASQRFLAGADLPVEARFRDGVGLVDFAYVSRPTALGRTLARSSALMAVLAILTVLLELSFPLILVGRRVRWLIFGSAAALHLGIKGLMAIGFMPFLLVFAVVLEHGQLWTTLSRRRRARD